MIDPQTVADWYDERYRSGQEQSFGRPVHESVLRLGYLPPREHLRILDVGSGQGYFLLAASEAGHHVIGIDVSRESVRISNTISQTARACVASGQHLPFESNAFDVVTYWGTLEHHQDMRQALDECHRVIKPDGQIILRVPNRQFWVDRLRSLFGLQTGTEQAELIEHALSLDEWKMLIDQTGFEVISVAVDDWFLRQPFKTAIGWRKKLTLAFRKVAIAVAPLNQTYVFDIVCRPRQ